MSFYPRFPSRGGGRGSGAGFGTPVKPGPAQGSQRPTGAPNFGSMGGRPPASTGVTSASPVERLLSDLVPGVPVSFPPASAGEMWPDASGGAGAAEAGAPPTTGAPSAAAGEMWPDAQGAPSTGAPSAPQSPITINVGTGGGATAPDANVGGAPGAGQPGAEAPTTAASPAQPQPGLPPTPPPAPPPVKFERTPREDELALVPEGSEVITPYGTGVKKGGKVDRYNLTPAGQEAYKRAIVAARERYGPTPYDGDLDAPFNPPIVLDGWNFNPWSAPGREWSRG